MPAWSNGSWADIGTTTQNKGSDLFSKTLIKRDILARKKNDLTPRREVQGINPFLDPGENTVYFTDLGTPISDADSTKLVTDVGNDLTVRYAGTTGKGPDAPEKRAYKAAPTAPLSQKKWAALYYGIPLEQVTDALVFAAGRQSTEFHNKVITEGQGTLNIDAGVVERSPVGETPVYDKNGELISGMEPQWYLPKGIATYSPDTTRNVGDLRTKLETLVNPKTDVDIIKAINTPQHNTRWWSNNTPAQIDIRNAYIAEHGNDGRGQGIMPSLIQIKENRKGSFDVFRPQDASNPTHTAFRVNNLSAADAKMWMDLANKHPEATQAELEDASFSNSLALFGQSALNITGDMAQGVTRPIREFDTDLKELTKKRFEHGTASMPKTEIDNNIKNYYFDGNGQISGINLDRAHDRFLDLSERSRADFSDEDTAFYDSFLGQSFQDANRIVTGNKWRAAYLEENIDAYTKLLDDIVIRTIRSQKEDSLFAKTYQSIAHNEDGSAKDLSYKALGAITAFSEMYANDPAQAPIDFFTNLPYMIGLVYSGIPGATALILAKDEDLVAEWHVENPGKTQTSMERFNTGVSSAAAIAAEYFGDRFVLKGKLRVLQKAMDKMAVKSNIVTKTLVKTGEYGLRLGTGTIVEGASGGTTEFAEQFAVKQDVTKIDDTAVALSAAHEARAGGMGSVIMKGIDDIKPNNIGENLQQLKIRNDLINEGNLNSKKLKRVQKNRDQILQNIVKQRHKFKISSLEDISTLGEQSPVIKKFLDKFRTNELASTDLETYLDELNTLSQFNAAIPGETDRSVVETSYGLLDILLNTPESGIADIEVHNRLITSLTKGLKEYERRVEIDTFLATTNELDTSDENIVNIINRAKERAIDSAKLTAKTNIRYAKQDFNALIETNPEKEEEYQLKLDTELSTISEELWNELEAIGEPIKKGKPVAGTKTDVTERSSLQTIKEIDEKLLEKNADLLTLKELQTAIHQYTIATVDLVERFKKGEVSVEAAQSKAVIKLQEYYALLATREDLTEAKSEVEKLKQKDEYVYSLDHTDESSVETLNELLISGDLSAVETSIVKSKQSVITAKSELDKSKTIEDVSEDIIGEGSIKFKSFNQYLTEIREGKSVIQAYQGLMQLAKHIQGKSDAIEKAYQEYLDTSKETTITYNNNTYTIDGSTSKLLRYVKKEAAYGQKIVALATEISNAKRDRRESAETTDAREQVDLNVELLKKLDDILETAPSVVKISPEVVEKSTTTEDLNAQLDSTNSPAEQTKSDEVGPTEAEKTIIKLTYQGKGQPARPYSVDFSTVVPVIKNSKGTEVFKAAESGKDSVNRNKIIAKAEVFKKSAVVVKDSTGSSYIVNRENKIISLTTGHNVYKEGVKNTLATRTSILAQAKPLLQALDSSTKKPTPTIKVKATRGKQTKSKVKTLKVRGTNQELVKLGNAVDIAKDTWAKARDAVNDAVDKIGEDKATEILFIPELEAEIKWLEADITYWNKAKEVGNKKAATTRIPQLKAEIKKIKADIKHIKANPNKLVYDNRAPKVLIIEANKLLNSIKDGSLRFWKADKDIIKAFLTAAESLEVPTMTGGVVAIPIEAVEITIRVLKQGHKQWLALDTKFASELKKDPTFKYSEEYREAMHDIKHTGPLFQDMWEGLVLLSEHVPGEGFSLGVITDNVPFKAGEYIWNTHQQSGDTYTNHDLCTTCANTIQPKLRLMGIPSAVASFAQADWSGKFPNKLGDHKAVIIEYEGTRYIVDHPQSEMFSPLNPPKANTGTINTTTWSPRFIELTADNLESYYGLVKEKDILWTVKSLQNTKLKTPYAPTPATLVNKVFKEFNTSTTQNLTTKAKPVVKKQAETPEETTETNEGNQNKISELENEIEILEDIKPNTIKAENLLNKQIQEKKDQLKLLVPGRYTKQESSIPDISTVQLLESGAAYEQGGVAKVYASGHYSKAEWVTIAKKLGVLPDVC